MTQWWRLASAPDNVAVLLLLVAAAICSLLAFRQAVANDRRGRETGSPEPAGAAEEVFVWPYLARLEFLAALGVVLGLLAWSVALDAPLEELADPSLTPNPAKAPWYFLGLQELLVYFDPWIAGVVLPGLIVVGLAAIPYLDVNPAGNGRYSLEGRRFAIAVFGSGYLLWIALILIGVFLRGPGWQWFWPWEPWDSARAAVQDNRDFSELFGVRPRSPFGMALGALPLLAYYGAGMSLPYRSLRRARPEFLARFGPARYAVTSFLLLTMAAVPVKIVLRLALRLKYVLVTPWFSI